MMLPRVSVYSLCIISTHKCIIGEKSGRGREQSDGSA